MKRLLLVPMLFIPLALGAQEKDTSPKKAQPGVTGTVQEEARLAGVEKGATFEAARQASEKIASARGASARQEQKGRQSRSKSVGEKTERPRTEGSMVGYIDDAIIGSQVRIRFDAAFRDNAPDRSEFFYAKCGCYRFLPHGLNIYDRNAPGPGPGIPTSVDYQQLYLYGEYAPTPRFSVFTEVPFRWLQPVSFVNGTVPPGLTAFSNQAGLSDVEAGFKFAMLASSDRYLTFQFRSFFPSGDASKGLGTNHYSIEPAVLFYQKLTERMAIEAQVGDWHPIGGSAGVPTASSQGFAGDVFDYGVGPSYTVYENDRLKFTPVVELVGWHVVGGLQTGLGGPLEQVASDASGDNYVNLKVGARTTIGLRHSFYIGFGQALTHEVWYKHIVRAEYRYSF